MKIACFIDANCYNSKLVQNNKITQENKLQSVAIISYLQVVDDGDGVMTLTGHHGADLLPGFIIRIEFQDVVYGDGVTSDGTCILLYYFTNCIGNNASHE